MQPETPARITTATSPRPLACNENVCQVRKREADTLTCVAYHTVRMRTLFYKVLQVAEDKAARMMNGLLG
ncbi:hypothetical protein J6590_014150 [Homalodisca vitripennis]|nr:hypothetical protein J6590_014150 [Homalodisca vitripennis]